MTMIGTVDLGGIDLGNLDTFGDRMALAKVVGGRAIKRAGRWVMTGGARNGVRLDHPTVLRIMGGPLEAEAGTVRYEPDADMGACGMDRAPDLLTDGPDWTPGAELMAWFDSLTDEATCTHAAALIAERMGEAVAVGAGPELRERVRALALLDALGLPNTAAECPESFSESEKSAPLVSAPVLGNLRAPITRPVFALPTFTPRSLVVQVGSLPYTLDVDASGHLCVTAGGQLWGARLDARGVIHGASTWGLDGRTLLTLRAAAADLVRGAGVAA